MVTAVTEDLGGGHGRVSRMPSRDETTLSTEQVSTWLPGADTACSPTPQCDTATQSLVLCCSREPPEGLGWLCGGPSAPTGRQMQALGIHAARRPQLVLSLAAQTSGNQELCTWAFGVWRLARASTSSGSSPGAGQGQGGSAVIDSEGEITPLHSFK